MKKRNIINLIKYHIEHNEMGFREEAYNIAKGFDKMGDYQLAEYVSALLSSTNTFVPQVSIEKLEFLKELVNSVEPLPLPEEIQSDIAGIINAIGHNIGVNKFLFQGAPGTGKTETVKNIARILDRKLLAVDFAYLIDSKLGQTSKNILKLFDEINRLPNPEKVVVLFDEIDSIAMDRKDSNDLREMGRATTTILKGLDELNSSVLLIATTNLYEYFDKALLRRFDSIISFNRYSREDLLDISGILVNYYIDKFKFSGKNSRLFRKIINLMGEVPYPGDLKNLIKTSIAFSNPNEPFDYLRRIYLKIAREVDKGESKIEWLSDKGFTLREIEIVTGISKSKVARELKGGK